MSNIGIPSSPTIGIFEGKSIITSVSFGSECTYIGDNAFKNCESLKQINDDNMIECIGNNTFKDCVSLKQSNDDSSVDNNSTEKIPILNFNNLTRLGESAFENCKSLENVSMDKCFTISPSAFKDCTSLSSVNIPKCTKIGSLAFMSCKALKNVKLNSDATNTEILSSAFYDCENLSDIYLDNCAKIEFAAFENCLSLSKITLNKCREIGSRAFYGCKNLSEVHINTPRSSDGLPYCKLVDINAFEGANENIQFYIAAEIIHTYQDDPNWSKYVNQMKQLNKDTQIIYMTTDNMIGFNNTVGSDSNSDSDGITSYTISYNGSFGIVEFDNTLLSLNDKLFNGLTTLSGIEFPDKCERIGEKEFSGCESLSYVKLPNVKYIDNYAFENCISLTRFTIPDSVCELGDGVFAGCENIIFEGKFATADGKAVVSDYNETTPDPEIYNKKYKLISVSPKDERRKLDISEIDPKISILGEKCFYGCKNLRRVDIHDGVTDIGNNAFEGCENLYEVYFHGNGMFNSIGENVFKDVATDFKIFVPEELLEVYIQSLGKYKDHIYPIPANNCIICYTTNDGNDAPGVPSELGMILCRPKDGRKYYRTATGAATNIPNGWFTNNDKITEVILGEDVTSIGYSAFKNCPNLEYIHLSDKIYSFGTYCFKECTGLTSIHIPNSLDTFGDYIFEMCSNLKEFREYEKKHVSDDRRCCIDGDKIIYFASSDFNAANDYLIPYGIKEICKGAFRGSNIESIHLNQTKIIGENAFQKCPLKNIKSWGQVNDIQSYAFENSALEEISLPSNLTNIGDYAFCNCQSVYLNGNIPQKVTNIGKGAFKNCTNFKCVNENGEDMLTLGKITSINNNTFENCTSLTEVKISDSVTQIGISAFSGCGITSVSITTNSNLKTISTGAFYNCNSLECLPLPMKLTQIGTDAFRNCKSYVGFSIDDFVTSMPSIGSNLPKKLTIPISVSSIGTNAFENTGICDVVIPNNSNLTSIPNNAFLNCQELKTISILSTKTTSIGNNAFSGCSKLCEKNGILNLPNNITYIGDSAFKGCQYISTLPLPSNLKILGNDSFKRGDKATTTLTVTIPTGLSTPPILSSINSEPFDKNNLIIYIPEQYVDIYKANFQWDKYKNAFRVRRFNGGTDLEFDDGKLDTDFENQVKPFQ